MPKYKSRRASSKFLIGSDFWSRISHHSVIMALAFVLVIGGIGGYFIGTSFAYVPSTSCIHQTFTTADENYYSGCVLDAQGMMWADHNQTGWPHFLDGKLAKDGYYGPQTKYAIASFQSAFMQGQSYYSGILGPDTWQNLCDANPTHGVNWKGAGC